MDLNDMIECKFLRQPRPGARRHCGFFPYRYDAHLVPDFIENIRPSIYGLPPGTTVPRRPSSRPNLKGATVIAQAHQMGARWILALWTPMNGSRQTSSNDCQRSWPWGNRTSGPSPCARCSPLTAIARRDMGREKADHPFPGGETGGGHRPSWHMDCRSDRLQHPRRREPPLSPAHDLALNAAACAVSFMQRQTRPASFRPSATTILMTNVAWRWKRSPEGREFTPPFIEDHGLWTPIRQAWHGQP